MYLASHLKTIANNMFTALSISSNVDKFPVVVSTKAAPFMDSKNRRITSNRRVSSFTFYGLVKIKSITTHADAENKTFFYIAVPDVDEKKLEINNENSSDWNTYVVRNNLRLVRKWNVLMIQSIEIGAKIQRRQRTMNLVLFIFSRAQKVRRSSVTLTFSRQILFLLCP